VDEPGGPSYIEAAGGELVLAARLPGLGEVEVGPGLAGASRGLGQDLDVPVRPMHANPLPIPDQPGGMLHAHDGR